VAVRRSRGTGQALRVPTHARWVSGHNRSRRNRWPRRVTGAGVRTGRRRGAGSGRSALQVPPAAPTRTSPSPRHGKRARASSFFPREEVAPKPTFTEHRRAHGRTLLHLSAERDEGTDKTRRDPHCARAIDATPQSRARALATEERPRTRDQGPKIAASASLRRRSAALRERTEEGGIRTPGPLRVAGLQVRRGACRGVPRRAVLSDFGRRFRAQVPARPRSNCGVP